MVGIGKQKIILCFLRGGQAQRTSSMYLLGPALLSHDNASEKQSLDLFQVVTIIFVPSSTMEH